MNNSFKLFSALLLAGGFALSLSSCKDSEDVAVGPTPEEMAHSKGSASAMGLLSVLSFTSQLDSLPDNWYANNYTVEPTVGTVNDQSTPFVRYVPVHDKDEAIAKYNSIADKVIPENSTSATFNIENVGSVKFNVLDQADVTATLDLNIKQQPHLTQIRFVPASAMGDNASFDGEPFYTFGDIVKVKEGTRYWTYWVCVRPCSRKEKKSTSHWMSFNLNDWDWTEKLGIPKNSLNIKKITKKGCEDYFVPTQLGNESGSREHMQNLFKLLYILSWPARYNDFPNGIGGIGKGELTQDMVENIARYWIDEKMWLRVLPSPSVKSRLQECFREDVPSVNVFYHGYHNKWFNDFSVHRAVLKGETLSLDNYGQLEWTREKGRVDFRTYAQYGDSELFGDEGLGIANIPERGFIVRYKTGRQLGGGGSGNDVDPTKSFESIYPDTVENEYVYREIDWDHYGDFDDSDSDDDDSDDDY